jgi:hypothetical protein
MKRAVFVAVLMLINVVAVAQAPAPTPPPAPRPPMPGLDMGMFHPPAALTSEWWKDPEVALELHLTDAQIKTLQQASVNAKLSAIDAGANGLKSFVQLQSLLDADQVDQAAYSQQLDTLAAAANKLIKEFGAMALTARKTLSAEQWHKLEALRAARRPPGPERPMAPHPRRPANPQM